jgi:hypothetical protein
MNKIEPNQNSLQPESVTLSRSGSEVILAFPQINFLPGSYQVRINGAIDADRVPIDTTRNRAVFTVEKEPPRFYVVSAKLESPQQVLVYFNLPLDAASATEISNYKIKNLGSANQSGIALASAAIVANEPTAVRLTLARGALGPLGRKHVIEISGVRSAAGISLKPGEGDAIGFAMASANLNHVLIYPNPFVSSQHAIITVAGLTPQAVVKILDVNGRVLKTLEEIDGNGGLDWDTRDSNGNLVSSGVYLCFVASGTQTAVTKFVIIR